MSAGGPFLLIGPQFYRHLSPYVPRPTSHELYCVQRVSSGPDGSPGPTWSKSYTSQVL
jgi:hypothetical protein